MTLLRAINLFYLTAMLSLFPLLCKGERHKKVEEIIEESAIPHIQIAFHSNNKTSLIECTSGEYKATAPPSKTVFQAASLSKPIFAYIVLKMASQGEIDLDRALIEYLGEESRISQKERDWLATLTARMVLNHKTGLPNWATAPSSKEWPASKLHFKFRPDSTFSYSGEGFTLLQKSVEKIKGKSLQEIATEEVFIPFGMKSSSYSWGRDDLKELDYDIVATVGHNSSGESVGQGRHPRANSAYTLRTTAYDYSLFLSALIEGRGLDRALHQELFEPAVKAVRYPGKERECDSSIFWGLGVGIEENRELGRLYFHWGDNGEFKALFIINPSDHSFLIYLTNSAKGHSIIDKITPLFFNNREPLALSSWINSN